MVCIYEVQSYGFYSFQARFRAEYFVFFRAFLFDKRAVNHKPALSGHKKATFRCVVAGRRFRFARCGVGSGQFAEDAELVA